MVVLTEFPYGHLLPCCANQLKMRVLRELTTIMMVGQHLDNSNLLCFSVGKGKIKDRIYTIQIYTYYTETTYEESFSRRTCL